MAWPTVLPLERMTVPRLIAGGARAKARGWLKATTILCAGCVAMGVIVALVPVAQAQVAALNQLTTPRPGQAQAPMLLEADEVIYNEDEDTVTAVGKVQIYYGATSLQARKVIYNRKTERVFAEGDVRIVDETGNVVTAESADVTRSFAEGFIKSVRIDTVQRTRITAESATRRDDNVTEVNKATYTACVKCRQTPERPPTWQIKAAKVVQNQQEQMVYYQDARLEFWGVPLAYVPYFAHPDLSVKRKSGFLSPNAFVSDLLGVGVSAGYFWAPAQDWDITLRPSYLSRQGLVGDVEIRHAVDGGQWSLRMVGLHQNDPDAFRTSSQSAATWANDSSNRTWRGMLSSTGNFSLGQQWAAGWRVNITSDVDFLTDYSFSDTADESTRSEIFLRGSGDRSLFNASLLAFGLTFDDRNGVNLAFGSGTNRDRVSKQPFVLPVIDYAKVLDESYWGGELALTANLTSITRLNGDWQNINGTAGLQRKDDRIVGSEGAYTRLSGQVDWRRQIIDPFGQVFTPFAYVKGDLFMTRVDSSGDGTSLGPVAPSPKSAVFGRFMPAVGIEYRYPILAAHAWGNQVFEPVAQVILRPDENQIGSIANEDSQSFVFDDANLFDWDKFSGFDRTEGGSRANVGFNYTLTLNNGGSISALIGKSFQLAGRNSFAIDDIALTGRDSGLDQQQSDYVARLFLDLPAGLRVGTRARFDETTFALNRAEVQASAYAGPLTLVGNFAYLREQPNLGINHDRREVAGGGNLRLSETWRVFGQMRYDLEQGRMITGSGGLGYDDDSFSVSLSFGQNNGLKATDKPERVMFLRFGLRTLGDGDLNPSIFE